MHLLKIDSKNQYLDTIFIVIYSGLSLFRKVSAKQEVSNEFKIPYFIITTE